ncbi:MAG: hypothetical protein SV062_01540 [Thermodesulfobacteriota bacterium]|nr:hypothetical protein [Thermodesulfobacteriota bacterium]
MIKMVQDWFVPLRINSDKQGDLFEEYLVAFTPTIVIMDDMVREHFRFTGFLSPEEMCGRIILDGAKTEINLKNYTLAEKCFNEIIEHYKGTFAVPEAVFFLTVAKFLASHEPKVLKEGLERMRKEFPDSEWTLRAKPYELIK